MGRNRGSGSTIGTRSGGTSGSSDGPSMGGGGAGGAGGIGAGGVGEMSERVDERIAQIEEIEVDSPSSTRGMETLTVRFDPASPTGVQVSSPSGNTYDVDEENETCTCPDHRYRGGRCRHMNAVAEANEQRGSGIMPGSARPQDVDPGETLQSHIDNEATAEAEVAAIEFTDDNHFYSDDVNGMTARMMELSTQPIPYDRVNALNGSDVTFGIELEFVGGNSHAIARELYDLGICDTPRRKSYHASRTPGKWSMERDGSVSSGIRGGELVSPILQDTPETWANIEKICEVAKRHGAQVDGRTGGHVHISTEPLDGKRQRWRRLFKAYGRNEEAVYRFSGGEQGRVRGMHYINPANEQLASAERTRLPAEGSMNDFRDALHHYRSGIGWNKYRSLNMVPFTSNVRNTVEIRAFNGSLEPGVIQANVKVAAGLVHTAERSSRTQGSEAFQRRSEIIDQAASSGRRSNKDVARFVDTFFTRKHDQDHILSIMGRNDWRRR